MGVNTSYSGMSSSIVVIDGKGRIVIPVRIRESVGLKPGDKVIVRARGDGVIEVISLENLKKEVYEIARKKFANWREEDHEATRFLEEMFNEKGMD